MPLYFYPKSYGDSLLQQWIPDGTNVCASGELAELVTYCISSAPPGKHALELCERYEEAWRSIATQVLAELKGMNSGVVWADGRFESDGILQLIKYVDEWNKVGVRYHINGFTYPGGRGYYSSWVSFEFDADTFQQIVLDRAIDFEETRLAMLICRNDEVESIIGRELQQIGLAWILEKSAMVLATSRHFEGLEVGGARTIVDEAIKRVKSRLAVESLE